MGRRRALTRRSGSLRDALLEYGLPEDADAGGCLVGHTHNKLDLMFSRISVALRGKDYFTEDADAAELGMEDRLKPLLGATRSRDLHPAR